MQGPMGGASLCSPALLTHVACSTHSMDSMTKSATFASYFI